MIRTLTIVPLFLSVLAWAQPSTPDNKALVHIERSRKAYAAEDYELALAYADSALRVDAELPGGLKLRGDIKQRQNDLHGALVDYTRAERLDNTDPRLYVSRSAVYVTEGRLKEAVRDTERALELDPTDADAIYNRSCASYLGRQYTQALRDLEHSLELRPNNPDALFLRGVVKGELYKEDAGLADIQAAIELNPSLAGARMSAGVLLFEMARFEEAIAEFGKVIAAEDIDLMEAHYYRAESYYNLDDKENACVDYKKSSDLGDKDAQFIYRNYCLTDETKIPKKPVRKPRKTVIEF